MRTHLRQVAGALWLISCAVAGVVASAAAAPFSVEVWDTERGLPQNTVIALAQTRDGYLWAGTYNGGLARFDGARFTVYTEGNTEGLGSSQVVKLFEDSQRNLWIGTETAGIFVAKDGHVRLVDVGRGTRQGRVMSICEDSQGAIWLYTADGQLCRYKDQRGDVWNAGSEFPSRCRALAAEGDRVWVGSDWSLTAVGPVPAGPAKGLPVAQELSVRRLEFLLASARGGYWRLAGGRIQKWQNDRLEKDLASYPWLASAQVTSAAEDREGRLVVGTYGDGVYWFDDKGAWTHLSTELPSSYILSLLVDRDGCLWVGTDGGGLARVKPQVFSVFPYSLGLVVKSVCEDRQGGLWVGYHDERLHHWADGKLAEFTNLVVQAGLRLPPGDKLHISSVLVDSRGRVWAGTDGAGLLQFDNGRFRLAPGTAEWGKVISALFEDSHGRLWVGTPTGLAGMDEQGWHSWATTAGFLTNNIRALAEDKSGDLWIGTEGAGLARLRGSQVDWFGKANGLPSKNVFSLCCDDEGVLWVGTASGLARFKAGEWTSYTGLRGLSGANIGYLADDKHGCLWLGSNAGLFRVRKAELERSQPDTREEVVVRAYGKSDGLPIRECSQGSQPAVCVGKDGKLWFATIRGLVSVAPADLAPNTNPPPVLIEAVSIDGRLQGTNALRSPPPTRVTVPAGRESVEISYTSLYLSAPENSRFRYRMENYETAWTERPGSVRSARYSHLPPGHYRFQVTAGNEDGVWNSAGTSVEIIVLPPFWKQWWFVTATGLALLGLVVGSVHYVSTQKLQRQLAAMRQKEALEKERARIARDLHDQLGANLTQVALLGELAETDKDLPQEVEGHARQISQTARDTTRALDEIVWTVNPSNDTLDGLVNYICKYAQEYLALADLKYRIETPPELPATPISPELRHNVFLAAKEAINNVVKHAQATSAWLRLRVEPARCVLEIEDDGTGLPAEAANKGRNGLRNMQNRMRDIGGTFEAVARTGGGTIVRLTAPLPDLKPRVDAPET